VSTGPSGEWLNEVGSMVGAQATSSGVCSPDCPVFSAVPALARFASVSVDV